ncbi:MAG: lysophospholipid acyltransferase family protein [bacterium]
MRILKSGTPIAEITKNIKQDQSLVIYSNHASWWDPLVCLTLLKRLFPNHSIFAPIEETMLEKYKIFRRLGFFGVEKGTIGGALQFIAASKAILSTPNNLLVITPQGRFADVRERPLHFEGGIGYLASRIPGTIFLPCAVEYTFWEESQPEILVCFGEPVELTQVRSGVDSVLPFDPKICTKILEEKLRDAQDILAAERIKREASHFEVVWSSDGARPAIYDLWRGMRARLRGENFQRKHGTK